MTQDSLVFWAVFSLCLIVPGLFYVAQMYIHIEGYERNRLYDISQLMLGDEHLGKRVAASRVKAVLHYKMRSCTLNYGAVATSVVFAWIALVSSSDPMDCVFFALSAIALAVFTTVEFVSSIKKVYGAESPSFRPLRSESLQSVPSPAYHTLEA